MPPGTEPDTWCRTEILNDYGTKGGDLAPFNFPLATLLPKHVYKNYGKKLSDFDPEVRGDICADEPSTKGC